MLVPYGHTPYVLFMIVEVSIVFFRMLITNVRSYLNGHHQRKMGGNSIYRKAGT